MSLEREHVPRPEAGRSVSVVIPAYQPGTLLVRALESVQAQTRPPEEVIVVDDGCTDGSVDRARAAFPAARFIALDANLGVSVARNRGVEAAQGALIAFLDADDTWREDKLLRQLQAMERAGAEVGLTGFFDLRASRRQWGTRSSSGPLDALLTAGVPMMMSSLIVDRALLLDAGGFDPSLPRGEDMECLYRLALGGVMACFEPQPLASYHHDNKASLTQGARRILRYSELAQRLRAAAEVLGGARLEGLLRAATRHFAERAASDLLRGSAHDDWLDDLLAHGSEGVLRALGRARRLPGPLRRIGLRHYVLTGRLRRQRRFFGMGVAR